MQPSTTLVAFLSFKVYIPNFFIFSFVEGGKSLRRMHLFIHLCCLWLISAESLEPPMWRWKFKCVERRKKKRAQISFFLFRTVQVFVYHIPGLRGRVSVGHGWLLDWPISDFPLAAVTLFVSWSCYLRLQTITENELRTQKASWNPYSVIYSSPTLWTLHIVSICCDVQQQLG